MNIEFHSVLVFLLCFMKVRVCCVQVQFLGQFTQSDSESSLLTARNASVMIPKFSVNRVVYCSLWKNKPSSH